MKVSRRSLLLGAAAAPIPSFDRAPDPVVDAVNKWLSARSSADALALRWQRLETQLFKRCKRLGLTRALRSGLPEARELRALTRKINAAERKLERSAARIAQMRAMSGPGALAKIEMGLKIQAPQDCEEMAWALIKGGADELREVLGR
jgi:hypothetical protein